MLRVLIGAAAIAVSAHASFAASGVAETPLTSTGSWVDLQEDIVGDIAILDGADLFDVSAPYRASDAATVPIVIRQMDGNTDIIKAITVVIDENPAPLAAEIQFGAAMSPLQFEMRVRVNMYSNVRVIADTDDGAFMNGRFVKASGGCSAPATKDPELALASMGKMRLKHFGDSANMSTPRREAQIMIRHPNYSGLQRNQVTQLFISAHFIDTLEVYQGDEMLFILEGGISVSENPVFRFEYNDNGADSFRVRAHDTEGNVFETTLAKDASS